MLKTLHSSLALFGIDAGRTVQALSALPAYFRNYRSLKRQSRTSQTSIRFGRFYPCLGDRSDESGSGASVYFQQDLAVARRVFLTQPAKHVDVGSRIDGFVAHIATFRPIEVFDIRPLTASICNVTFRQLDLMDTVPDQFLEYCDSLSCLHTIEHFGLGRYGDPIQFDGHLVGLDNLKRLLKPGGRFYFSTPIGPQRIEFDAHRVFSVAYLLELFAPHYDIERFSYINDAGRLSENVTLDPQLIQTNCGCYRGCGIFEMIKR